MGYFHAPGASALEKYFYFIIPMVLGIFLSCLITGYVWDVGSAVGAPELAVGYVGPGQAGSLQRADESCRQYKAWAPQVFHALDAEGFRRAFCEQAGPEAALPAFQAERDGELERGEAPWGPSARIGYTRLADRPELTAVWVEIQYAPGEGQQLETLYAAVRTALLALDPDLSPRQWERGLAHMEDFYQRFPVGDWQESFFLGRYRVQVRRDPYPAQNAARVQIMPRQVWEPTPGRTRTPQEITRQGP